MRVGSAGKKAFTYVLALCIGLVVVFSGYFSTTAYADTVTTPFEGDLDNSETFIRPMMPGDIVGADDGHPDYLSANLFYSLTWFYQSNTNVWVSGDGNYTMEASPMNPAYQRNYFVRKFVPSASGNFDIKVLEDGTTIEDKETTLFLYKGGFDPAQPMAYLYAGNDDTNAQLDPPLLYSSMVNVPLEAGTAYYIVMTSYASGVTGHVKFEVVGPGAVTVTDPANEPPSITSHPSNTLVTAGDGATFQVQATGMGDLTYQWQVNAGSGFQNISDGDVYSGATTSTLNLKSTTEDMDGYLYRVIVTGANGQSSTSGAATLRINHRPVFISTDSKLTVLVNDDPVDLKHLLRVRDTDSGQTLTWWEELPPVLGTLTIIGATALSGQADITPGGIITYQPFGYI